MKYGINDAFTLDMTLIPDFGEVQSDNQVLNLSPFEIELDERRPFFVEGAELFSKGNLFYSRRIGAEPLYYQNVENGNGLGENENIITNPETTKLLNATKFSGRTNRGLGIGVFNAIVDKSIAKIADHKDNIREITTNPLTNYNVIVLDQNLKNNSFLSLINANVLRTGKSYDANVTGTRFKFRNKTNSLSFSGGGTISQKNYQNRPNEFGHAYSLKLEKINKNTTWNIYHNQESHDYDPNDLGFLESPNNKEYGFEFEYNRYQPFWKFFNAGGLDLWTSINYLDKPNAYKDYSLLLYFWGRTKKNSKVNFWIYSEPLSAHDYFEPRTQDFSAFYAIPSNVSLGLGYTSDDRKKLIFDFNFDYKIYSAKKRYSFNWDLNLSYQVNNKLSFSWSAYNWNDINEDGYINKIEKNIIFGKRNNITFENTLNINYYPSNRMSIAFNTRHYWSKAEYNSFHVLTNTGNLKLFDYNVFSDNSFSSFNLDFVYQWQFAPASNLVFSWKQQISNWGDQKENTIYDYRKSFNSLKKRPLTNNLIIKIIYFLDYASL